MRKNSKLPTNLGRRIQRLRKGIKPKLTQERLAEKVGISTTYVGFIEQGKYVPSVEILEKIARQLKVSLKELFP